MNKVEGKVSDWCLKCKNCKAVTRMHGGKNASIRIIEVECEDPYDGMVKTLDVDSDICCSMFEPNSPCDKISLLQHELEMEKLRTKIHQLEKEKSDHLKGIERLKKSQKKLQNQVKNLKIYEDENKSMYEDLKYWRERCHGAETDVTTLNSKVETLKNKKDKYLKKILDQQTTHYKQCARILDLENMVNKLQSGEYDDILAKDIEIKKLQAKYEDAMAGWKGSMDTNDRLDQTISDLKEKNENLTKAVERRDKWVEELKSDVDTLQNECLSIAEIAKRAYDETNRD